MIRKKEWTCQGSRQADAKGDRDAGQREERGTQTMDH